MANEKKRARVIFSDPIWALIEQLKEEAEALRRMRPDHPDAAIAEAFASRLVGSLEAGEGQVWVGTADAVEITRKKPDTIRSWHRRRRVRTQKNGGSILYHRDDLLHAAAR